VIKHGEAPYLECSSRGDRRFSAFGAHPKSLGGRSIEKAYQYMKVFEDGTTGLSIQKAKGKFSVNRAECEAAYIKWWIEWVEQENLLPVLQAASGLSDAFGQFGHVCQATVLWNIRNGKYLQAELIPHDESTHDW
jgi:hypothetical protein